MCDQQENGASKRLLMTSLDDYGVSWGDQLSFRWDNEDTGKATATSYYSSFVKGVTRYSLNDTVYLESGNECPYIGRIVSMYQTMARREKQMIVRWFCRPCDLPEGLPDVDYSGNCKEVFLMWGEGAQNAVHPASTVRHCSVLCTADEGWNTNFPSVEEVAAADYIFDRAFCPGQLLLQNLDDIARQYGEHHVTGFAGESPVGYPKPVQSDGLVHEFKNSNCKRKDSSFPRPKAAGKRIGVPTPHKHSKSKANGILEAMRKPRVEPSAFSLKKDKGAPVWSRENRVEKRSRLESDIGLGEKNSKRPKSSFSTHIPSDHLNNKLRQPYDIASSSSAAFCNTTDLISPRRPEEIWAEDDRKWEQSLGRKDHQATKDATSDGRSVSSTSSDKRLIRDGKDTLKSPYPIAGHLGQSQKSFSSPAGAQDSIEANSSDEHKNGVNARNRISDRPIRPFGESSAVRVERRGQTPRQDHFDEQNWKSRGGSKTLAKILPKEALPLASAEKMLLEERPRQSAGDGSSVLLPDAKKSGATSESARSPVMSVKQVEVDFATERWPVELTSSTQKNNVRLGDVQQMEHRVEPESEHPPLSLESMVSSTLPIERQTDKITELANDMLRPTVERIPTELAVHYTATVPLEEIPKTVSESKKTFFNFSWKESLRLALEQRKAIFLQNLDPWFSSFEIKALLQELLQVPCDARMLPPRNFECYFTGRAVVLFKTPQAAVDALKRLRENWLMWSSDERPVLASWATAETGKSSPIRGFFSIEEKTEKYARLRLIGGQSSVVATSHSSQANTVEFDLGVQWRLLQERHKLAWRISSQREQNWEKQLDQKSKQEQEQERGKKKERRQKQNWERKQQQ